MKRLNKPAAFRPRAAHLVCLGLATIVAGSSASALAANGRARSPVVDRHRVPAVHAAQRCPRRTRQTYTISTTGSVELMKMDYSQRLLFPQVGHGSSDFPAYQPSPAPGTNREDVPNLWAGPLSPHVPN